MAILSAIGAGIGLASSIFGANKAAKAAEEQMNLQKEQRARNNAWYNRNYYQDFLNSTEANAAIERVKNTLRERGQEAKARQAVNGGTDEAAIATREADNKVLSDTIQGLAAGDSNIKRQVDAQKAAMDANQAAIENQLLAEKQAGMMNLTENGAGLIGSALQGVNWGKNKKTE